MFAKMNNSISGSEKAINIKNLEVLDKPSIPMLTIFSASSAIGFIGNLIILIVIFGSKIFRRKTNYLIANLSIGSIVYIVFGFFAAIYRNVWNEWPFGWLSCQWYCFMKRLPVAVLSFTTLALTADRNRVAGNPIQLTSSHYICFQIAGIWTFASLLMIPLGLSGSLEQTISSSKQNPIVATHCIEVWTFMELQIANSIIMFLVIHIIPVVVMISGLWKMRRKIEFLLKSRGSIGPITDRRLRLIRNSCIFTCVFITCWLPTGIIRFPIDLPKEFLPKTIREQLNYYNDVTLLFTYVYACFVPLILYGLSHELRNHLFKESFICYWFHKFLIKDDVEIESHLDLQVEEEKRDFPNLEEYEIDFDREEKAINIVYN